MSEGLPAGLARAGDGRLRCWWAVSASDYVGYHDEEWGRPVAGDRALFERFSLESFQSGLSWLTILRKREGFRRAFAGFDPERVAAFGESDVERLLQDAAIVRHRGKIEATIANARALLDIWSSGGSLALMLADHRPEAASRPERMDYEALCGLTTTPESVALSKTLKARGWRFVGPTTAYAVMQAVGVVNDHLEGCWVRQEVDRAQEWTSG